MKKYNRLIIMLILLSPFVINFFNKTGATSAAENVVVVVNKSRGNISRGQIKRIFTGKMINWPDGKPIKVFFNKNDSITESFCSKYIGRNAASVNSMWMKAKIRSGVAMPRKIPSTVILSMVKNSNTFIGFVKRSEANSNVKIIE